METEYRSYKSNIGRKFGIRSTHNIKGVDKSIKVERLIDNTSTVNHGYYRIVIYGEKGRVCSPVLRGIIPRGVSTAFVLDNGKRCAFVSNGMIIVCRAPHNGLGKIESIQISNKGKITDLDYIEGKDSFVATFDDKEGRHGNTVGYDINFNPLFYFPKYENNLGVYPSELKYDKDEGIYIFSSTGPIDECNGFRYSGYIDCLTGISAAQLSEVDDICVSAEQSPSVSFPEKEMKNMNYHEIMKKKAYEFKRETLKRLLASFDSDEIQYELVEKEGYFYIVAHIGGIAIPYSIHCDRKLHIYGVTPAYSMPCATLEINEGAEPIPFDSIYGRSVSSDEKVRENKNYSIKIKRENNTGVIIRGKDDDNGNIIGKLDVYLDSYNRTVSNKRDGFDKEELDDVVRKHFEFLSELVNIPLIVNPYGKDDSLDDQHKKRKNPKGGN